MIRRAASHLVASSAIQRQASKTFLPSTTSAIINLSKRTLTAKSPGTDPLELLRQESEGRNLCDADGYRTTGSHWAMSLAASGETTCHAPNLRTLTIQRITTDGIDFVTKKFPTAPTSCPYSNLNPVSFLYTVGKYKPGETVEQWRAEGACALLDLDTLIDRVANFSIAETVASVRLAEEIAGGSGSDTGGGGGGAAVSKDRTSMGNQAHFMELVQKAKLELEAGAITDAELAGCLGAWRFEPKRMERMEGGPDKIMWDRWEWLRSSDGTAWAEANHILPY